MIDILKHVVKSFINENTVPGILIFLAVILVFGLMLSGPILSIVLKK